MPTVLARNDDFAGIETEWSSTIGAVDLLEDLRHLPCLRANSRSIGYKNNLCSLHILGRLEWEV